MKNTFKLNGNLISVAPNAEIEIDENGNISINTRKVFTNNLGLDLEQVPSYQQDGHSSSPEVLDFTIHGAAKNYAKKFQNVGDKHRVLTNSKTGSGVRSAMYPYGISLNMRRITKPSARKNHEFWAEVVAIGQDNYQTQLAKKRGV